MALLNTDLLTARTQSFRATRHMLANVLQEGVYAAGDFKVTPGGASLQWSVAAGDAWVQGDDTTRQGLYHQVNDAAVTGLVAAGHATLPRIDQVILRIFDSSVTGVSDTPTLSTLAGTATAGATLDNRTGAAALPNSAIRLADILVPAAASGVISAANIRDRRPWARGACLWTIRTAGDYTTAAISDTDIDATNLQPRIECSGVPLRVTLAGGVSHSVANTQVSLRILQDGAVPHDSALLVCIGAGNIHSFTRTWDFIPTAGSHLFKPQYAGGTAGTTTLQADATRPLTFTIEELVRQNASNT